MGGNHRILKVFLYAHICVINVRGHPVTTIEKSFNGTVMIIVNYIGFVWGVSWRTLLLSIIAAIVSGVGVGVVSSFNGWPPSAIEMIAPYLGLPITLVVFAYIVCRKISNFGR